MFKVLCVQRGHLRNSLWVQYTQPWPGDCLFYALYLFILLVVWRPPEAHKCSFQLEMSETCRIIFLCWGGGEQPLALSLSWPPKPFCACSLTLLAPLMLAYSDLILSYSLCVAMVVQVRSSASLAGLKVLICSDLLCELTYIHWKMLVLC